MSILSSSTPADGAPRDVVLALSTLRFLLIEGDVGELETLLGRLHDAGLASDNAPIRIETATALREMCHMGAFMDCDLVMSTRVPELDALEILEILRTGGNAMPLIVSSRAFSVERADELKRAGARECLHIDQLPGLSSAFKGQLREENLRRQRREAQQTARLLEVACRLARNPILVTDVRRPGLPLVFVNAAFEKLTGYTAAEVLGRNPRMLHGADVDQPDLPLLRAAVHRGDSCEATLRNYRKDGSLFYNHMTISPLLDERGIISHFVGVQSNVTEHKENEERFRRALEREHELQAIKSSFVCMVSHEFRTPLGVINTAAHLLGKYSDQMSVEERSSQVHAIQTAVLRMTQMMEDLLLHGALETRKMGCKPSRTDLEALCRNIISEVGVRQENALTIECVVTPEVRYAVLDGNLLRHILNNLLSNALKYSPDGRPVRLVLRRVCGESPRPGGKGPPSQDQLELCVRDSGIGIPAADLPKLYESFHRAANVGNRPGTGMGLAIVKQCVDLHRGTIRVESREREGTAFWVCLPLTEAEHPDVRRVGAAGDPALGRAVIDYI